MTKPSIEQPEVLPAEPPRDQYAERVGQLHQAANNMAKGSILCAAIAGAVMIQKKASLGHGRGFTQWKESLQESKGIAPRTADNYIALAGKMQDRIRYLLARDPDSDLANRLLEQANSQRGGNLPDSNSQRVANLPAKPTETLNTVELLASLDPSDANAIMHSAVADAVRQVAPEDSLRQLYFAWDIVKRPRNKGGARPRKSVSDAEVLQAKTQAARTFWTDLLNQLDADEIRSTEPQWGFLSADERRGIIDILRRLADHIHKSLPGR